MDQRSPSSSDNELKDAVHNWLHSQAKIFFADYVTRLVNHKTTRIEKERGDCVEVWHGTHLSQIVIHEVTNHLKSSGFFMYHQV